MKSKSLEGGFVLESASVKEKKEKSHGKVGRASRFPLIKIPVNHGVFLGKGTEIAKISPLVHYFNQKSHRHLKCKTIERGGQRGIFVYRVKSNKRKEELAAAN